MNKSKKLLDLINAVAVWVIGLGLLFFTSACGGNQGKAGTSKEKEDTEETIDIDEEDDEDASGIESSGEKTPLTVNTEKTEPENCVIIFDASSSMKGYVDATVPGSFNSVVGAMNHVGKKDAEAFLHGNELKPIENILNKLQNKKIEWENESDLFGMVQYILNQGAANPANCYVLITDGIMSGTNAEIKADPSYNVKNRDILKSKLEGIIKRHPNGNTALYVSMFSTPFKGTYYAYDNSKKILENESRPFFVLVAGGVSQVNYVAARLQEINGEKGVEYGNLYPMSIKFDCKYIPPKKYKYEKKKNDGELEAEINISQLPEYAKNISYLKQNLEIIKVNKTGSKVLACENESADADGDYELELNGDKLEVEFSQRVINQLPATFEFRLKRVQPVWIMDASTDNDKTGYSPFTTFNLKYFLAPFLNLNGADYLNDVNKSQIEVIK